MTNTIKELNQWLQDNNITDIQFKPKKTEYFGTVIGIFTTGLSHNKCIMHSPATGELTQTVCREYGLDLRAIP